MLESWNMKKLLAIVVLGLLWGGNAYTENIVLNCKNLPVWQSLKFEINKENKTVNITEQYTQKSNKRSFSKPISYLDNKKIHIQFPNGSFWQFFYGSDHKLIFPDGKTNYLKCKNELNTKQLQTAKQDAIMFTIKDKREQCEAIGFKPKTEKFADCVLRLVELDIKKQQDNKIAAAQNSGNMQIANQLLQMRNDNNAQYLIDLGQQLLTPQSFNSNIYLPQTQNCTIMGFDSFAKMTCN